MHPTILHNIIFNYGYTIDIYIELSYTVGDIVCQLYQKTTSKGKSFFPLHAATACVTPLIVIHTTLLRTQVPVASSLIN